VRRIIVQDDALATGFDVEPLRCRGYDVQVVGDPAALERADQPSSLVLNAATVTTQQFAISETALVQKLNIDRLLHVKRDDAFSFNLRPNGVLADASISASDVTFQTELLSYFLQSVGSVAAGDPATIDLLSLARRIARSPVTVMINGPTGTGKEVIAQYLHRASERRDKPFVAVNCAAVPDSMLEAILFGYERGAFTGAYQPNKGIFRSTKSRRWRSPCSRSCCASCRSAK